MKITKIIWSILSKKYKKVAIIIFFLSILATALEALGIGLVVPTITLLIDDNIFNKYPLLHKLLSYFGNPSQSELIISGAIFLVLVFITKSIFLAFFAWRQSKFIYGIKADLSHKLFKKYLYLPYEFHLIRNSSHLIRNLTSEISQFSSNVIGSILILANEVFVVIALISLLFYFEPFGALIVLTIAALAMFFFQLITKSRLKAWGEQRQKHEGFKIQKAQEGLSGAKDLKLMGKENHFIEIFNIHNFNNAYIEIKQSTLAQIPRLWLESVGIICIGIIISISTYFSNSTTQTIPIIAVFAAAAFRIFPSSNRILSALQNLKYANVVTYLIYNELNQHGTKVYKNTPIKFEKNIIIDNVSYSYPNSSNSTLLDINLTIRKGDTIGIVGISGSGKSTLVDLILGLIEPTSGKIKVDNTDISKGMRNWQSQIGYVQQSIFLTDDTLKNNIAFGLSDDQIDKKALDQAIKTAQLEEFIFSLPKGLNTIVGERGMRISGGQRQRIGIARALYYNPSILVFDEATSALDNETEKELMNSIYNMKGLKTMIIVAHRLSTIANCDLCYRVENRKIKKVNNS